MTVPFAADHSYRSKYFILPLQVIKIISVSSLKKVCITYHVYFTSSNSLKLFITLTSITNQLIKVIHYLFYRSVFSIVRVFVVVLSIFINC